MNKEEVKFTLVACIKMSENKELPVKVSPS